MGKPARFKTGHNSHIPEIHASWKGGKIVNTQGYVLIHQPNHPFCDSDGYVREHRLVMEEHLGRILEPNEVVHHINGNKSDNRLENLQLMSKKQHYQHHYQNRPRDKFGRLLCQR
jgi:hypothetical protein